MLFHTVEFFTFFGVVWLIAMSLPHRRQNLFLLIASYVFYASWDPRFLAVVLLSTCVDYVAARRIRAHHDAKAPRRALRWAAGSITFQVTVLGLFKYTGVFTTGLGLALPVGISFYTFQSMAYVIDVYRRRVLPVTNPIDFALFIAFFPQLLAGPIERAARMVPQIVKPRRLRPDQVRDGCALILSGLVKKLFISDNLATFTRWGLAPGGAANGLDAYLVCVAFAIRAYADFSGYTDMARGFAKLLGFDLSDNFDRPFLATTPAAFWSRWHMSLTRWITDYIYGPLRRRLMKLGMSRSVAISIAIVVTMMTMGLWHRATVGYWLWVGLWGLILVAWRPLERARVARRWIPSRVAAVLGAFVVFHIFAFTLVLTKDPGRCAELWSLMAGGLTGVDASLRDLAAIAWYAWPLVAVELLGGGVRGIGRLPLPIRSAAYAVMVLLLVSGGSTRGEEFIYYAF